LESLLSAAIEQRFCRLCRTVGYVSQLERRDSWQLGQFIDVRPAVQFPPDAPWNSSSAPLGQTSAQWPAGPSVDPEALKFAAAWRRMYLTPRPPVLGRANDLSQSYSQRYGQSSNGAEEPEFLSAISHDGIGLEPRSSMDVMSFRCDRCRTPIWATEPMEYRDSLAGQVQMHLRTRCLRLQLPRQATKPAQGVGGPLFHLPAYSIPGGSMP
jgi:hypothetical protein